MSFPDYSLPQKECGGYRQALTQASEKLASLVAKRDGSFTADLQLAASLTSTSDSIPEHSFDRDSDCLFAYVRFTHFRDALMDEFEDAPCYPGRRAEVMARLAEASLTESALFRPYQVLMELGEPSRDTVRAMEGFLDGASEAPWVVLKVEPGFIGFDLDLLLSPFSLARKIYAFPLNTPASDSLSTIVQHSGINDYWVGERLEIPHVPQAVLATMLTLASDGAPLSEALAMAQAIES